MLFHLNISLTQEMKSKTSFLSKIRDTNPGILWTPPLVDVPETTVPLLPITTIPKIFNMYETYSDTLQSNLLNRHFMSYHQIEPQYTDF